MRLCLRWLDGAGEGRRKPAWMASLLAPVPEVRPQGQRRRGGAPRGVAVCLCLPAIREIRRGRYQVAPFGASPPLISRGDFEQTSDATRRENAKAWLFER